MVRAMYMYSGEELLHPAVQAAIETAQHIGRQELLAGLPIQESGMDIERVEAFLGHVGLRSVPYVILADAHAPETKAALVSHGINMSADGDAAAVYSPRYNLAIVDRAARPNATDAEHALVHETTHGNTVFEVTFKPTAPGVVAPVITNGSGFTEKGKWFEEARAVLYAAHYDLFAGTVSDEPAPTGVGELEVVGRYASGRTGQSTWAALGLELLIDRNPNILDVLMQVPTRRVWRELTKQVDKTSPVPLSEALSAAQPSTSDPYIPGMLHIIQNVYGGDLGALVTTGAVSKRMFEKGA